MKMPTVYVTQIPHEEDKATGAFVPRINISTAKEHGELIVMMPPRAPFQATSELIKQLREHLQNYDYEAGDCLLTLNGDPLVNAAAYSLLTKIFGVYTLLTWDRNLGRYLKNKMDFISH